MEQSPDVAPLPEAGSQTLLRILYRGTRAHSWAHRRVYIHAYIHIYIYIYTYIHIYIYTYIYIHIYIYMYLCFHRHMRVYISSLHICPRTDMRADVCMCMYVGTWSSGVWVDRTHRRSRPVAKGSLGRGQRKLWPGNPVVSPNYLYR